ncbi:MAG: TonB-dependent receptor, partial [Gammaproteobacteria bacterium]|nr:TonB-dependent receptor [Gammaproteobacteria bacterium]
SYDEEESQNLEGGIKTALLDGRAQLNLALFWSDISKYQLTTPVADPSGALNSIVTNQADGEVLGIEVDLLAQLSDSMRAGVTYALADSEFTGGCDEFQWSLTSGGGKFTGDPATSMNPSGMGDCSVAGHQFPMGSKHQASAFLDFSRPMNNGLNFVGNVNVSYESKRYTQLHQSSYTGAATLVGARIGVEGENWSLALLGRNLTNEDSAILATRWLQSPYFTFASLNVAPPTADRSAPRAFFALPRRERQLGLELSYDF